MALDTQPSQANSITLQGTSPANATSVNYLVTFDKSAFNVSADDFNLTTTGSAEGSVLLYQVEVRPKR